MHNRTVLLVAVLVVALCGGVATAGAGTSPEAAEPAASSHLTPTTSGLAGSDPAPSLPTADSAATAPDELPDEPIAVTYSFDVDGEDPLTGEVVVTVPEAYQARDGEVTLSTFGLRVTDADGFEGRASMYTWDGETAEASLEFETDVIRESAQFDGYDAYHGEDWALGHFGIDASYVEADREYAGAIDETSTPEATVGDWMSYVGAHEVAELDTGGQTVRLVVPENSTLADRDALTAAIEAAGHDLRVGARPDEIVAIAAPDPIRGGGLAYRNGDLWSYESAPPATWIHEYVHTRQGYRTADSAAWLIEAEGEFYSTLLALEHDRLAFAEFRRVLADGAFEDDPAEDVVLADPDTWTGTLANYQKGALVLAALDTEIRAATDGERTYAAVTRRLNAHEGPVDHAVFVETVEDVAGEPMDAFVDQYVAGEETPDPPSDPARYGTWDAFDVALTASIDDGAVAPGEAGTVPIGVTNDGTDPAVGVTATLTVPDGWTVVDADGATVSNGTLTWTAGELAPGDSIDGAVTLRAPAEAGGSDELALQASDADGNSVQTSPGGDSVSPPAVAIDAPAVAVTGETVTLDASDTTADGAIERYMWDLTGDGEIDAETAEPTVSTALEVPGEREVTVTVVDEHGLRATATAAMLVSDGPTVAIEGPATAPADEPVSLAALVESELGTARVEWALPDGSTAAGTDVVYAFDAGAQSVTVTVTDEAGVDATATHEVTGVGEPGIEIDGPEAATAGEVIAFDALVDATGETTVEWAVDGETPRAGTTLERAFEPGAYTITATVSDAFGREAAVTHELVVDANDGESAAEGRSTGEPSAGATTDAPAADGAQSDDPTPGATVGGAVAALALTALALARRSR